MCFDFVANGNCLGCRNAGRANERIVPEHVSAADGKCFDLVGVSFPLVLGFSVLRPMSSWKSKSSSTPTRGRWNGEVWLSLVLGMIDFDQNCDTNFNVW